MPNYRTKQYFYQTLQEASTTPTPHSRHLEVSHGATTSGRMSLPQSLASAADIADWVREGSPITSFPQGVLRLENGIDAEAGQARPTTCCGAQISSLGISP